MSATLFRASEPELVVYNGFSVSSPSQTISHKMRQNRHFRTSGHDIFHRHSRRDFTIPPPQCQEFNSLASQVAINNSCHQPNVNILGPTLNRILKFNPKPQPPLSDEKHHQHYHHNYQQKFPVETCRQRRVINMYRGPSGGSSRNSSVSNATPVLLMTPPLLGRRRSKLGDNSDKVDDTMFEGFDGVHTGEHSDTGDAKGRSDTMGYFAFDIDAALEKSGAQGVMERVNEEQGDVLDMGRGKEQAVDGDSTVLTDGGKISYEFTGTTNGNNSSKTADRKTTITPQRSSSSSPGLVDEMRKISVGSHQPEGTDNSFATSSFYDSSYNNDSGSSFLHNDEALDLSSSQPSHGVRPTHIQILDFDEAQLKSPKIRSPQIEMSQPQILYSRHTSPNISRKASLEKDSVDGFSDMHSLEGSIHNSDSNRQSDISHEDANEQSKKNSIMSMVSDHKDYKSEDNTNNSIESVKIVESTSDVAPQTAIIQSVYDVTDALHGKIADIIPSSANGTAEALTSTGTSSALLGANNSYESEITGEANTKLYHPKPQRLVSSTLTETPNVFEDEQGSQVTPSEEPITTEPSPIAQVNDALGVKLNDETTCQDSIIVVTTSDMDNKLSTDGYQPRYDSSVGQHQQEPLLSETSPMHKNQVVSIDENAYKQFSNNFDSNSNHFSQRPPSSIILNPENADGMIFYPAPIPVQLRLPPLLSKKNKPGIQTDIKARRRTSVPLAPPTWIINPMDRSSMISMGQPLDQVSKGGVTPSVYSSMSGHYRRSQSPTLSIDSDRATIEDDDDRNLEYEEEGDNIDGKKNIKIKKIKKIKKKKSKVFSSRMSLMLTDKRGGAIVDLDEFNYDSDDDVDADINATTDHLAFTNFNNGNRGITADAIQSGRMKPAKSLIEELEMRKAGKKIQTQRVRNQLEIVNAGNKFGSNHPLDYRQSRSLLELNHIANRDYEDQVEINKMSRVNGNQIKQTAMVASQSAQDDFVDEPLSARRARLRAQKESILLENQHEGETLAQRRARLRQVRESRVQPSLVA